MQKRNIIIGIVICFTIGILTFVIYKVSHATHVNSLSTQIMYNEAKIGQLQTQVNNAQQSLKTLKTNNEIASANLLEYYENVRTLLLSELEQQLSRYDNGIIEDMIYYIEDIPVNYPNLIEQSKALRYYMDETIFANMEKEANILSNKIAELELKLEEQNNLIGTLTTTLANLQGEITKATDEATFLANVTEFYKDGTKHFDVFKKKFATNVNTLINLTEQISAIEQLIADNTRVFIK